MTTLLGYTTQKLEALDSVRRFVEGGSSPAYPMMVFMESSNLCNLRCAMCEPFSPLNPFRASRIRSEDRGFMSMETARCVEELLPFAFKTPVFGYGEPTLSTDFPELLDMCGEYETLTSFFTNGTRLTPELCEQIVRNRVHEVTFSFSGSTKAEYEAVYQGSEWETVVGAIRQLARQKRLQKTSYPIISVNSIGYRHHIEHLEKFVRIMAGIGVDQIILIPLTPAPTTPQLAHHMSIPRSWAEGRTLWRAKVLARLLGIRLAAGAYEARMVSTQAEYDSARATAFASFGIAEDSVPIPLAELKNHGVVANVSEEDAQANIDAGGGYEGSTTGTDLGARDVYCFEPFNTLYVNRNGFLKPCCNALMPTRMGNLNEQSALGAWQGDVFETVRDTIVDGAYPDMCRNCVRFEPHPQHQFLATAKAYADWAWGAHHQHLPAEWAEVVQAIEAAGSNEAIVERQRGRSR